MTSWNTIDDTRRCLESLHVAAKGLAYEVVAVDNGSLDGSAELLAGDPRVTLIPNVTNRGFAAAMNQAYRAASGRLILLLNSDICFHPDALRTMVDFLAEHDDASGVSPLYLNPDGSFQQHYVQLPSLSACLALWTVLKRVPLFRRELHRFEMRGQDFSQPRELASGSCMLMRSAAVGPNGLFDEAFPIYWNDAILAAELQSAGHRMWMIPDAVVTHSRGASCRRLGPAMRFRHLLGGMVCYLRRTQPGYRLEIFRAVVIADYLLKTISGRRTTLGWSDLLAALRGDVGPLPDGETCDWEVVVGSNEDLAPPTTAIRRLLVEDVGVNRGDRFGVHRTDDHLWRATLPARLPFGFLPPIGWLNRRWATAQLRRWLDAHAGARTLDVDSDHAYLIGWLGEDITASIRSAGPSGVAVHG